jgi:hypothetical protein
MMLPNTDQAQDSIFVEKCDESWYQYSDDLLNQTDLKFYAGDIVVKITTNGFIWNHGNYLLLAGKYYRNLDTLSIAYDWHMTVDSLAAYDNKHYLSNFQMYYGKSFEMMKNETYLIQDSGLVWLKPISKESKLGRKKQKEITKRFIENSKSNIKFGNIKSLTDSLVISPELGYVTIVDSSYISITYSKFQIVFYNLNIYPGLQNFDECIILPGQTIGYLRRNKRKYKCRCHLLN